MAEGERKAGRGVNHQEPEYARWLAGVMGGFFNFIVMKNGKVVLL